MTPDWLRGLEIAHRGFHDSVTPENSLAAFAVAISRGLAIECDVQLTADGEAVVFHDFALDRLTGDSGPVVARTAAELVALRLTGSEQTIPSLATMLEFVGGRVPILIEVKSRNRWPIATLCAAVERNIAGYEGRVAVMSFDPRVSGWFRRHAPGWPRGLVLSEYERAGWKGRIVLAWAMWVARPQFLAVDVRGLPGRIAAHARRRGLPVATWTIRTPAQRAIALAHADACIAEGAGLP